MKFAIIAGVAITCLLLAPAFAASGGTYAQDGYSCWQSNARNCICSYAVNGPSEFNREGKNGTTIIEVFRGGRGFALSGNQFHVVKVVAKSKRTIDASKASMIRDLLRSNSGNKTFAELKKDALAIIGEPVYNGSLRFGQGNYALVNMKMASADNSSVLEADLSPQVKGEASGGIAGHIKLTTSTHEGFRVSNGDLNLNGSDYKVFINMTPLHGARPLQKDGKHGRANNWVVRVDSGPMTG